MDKSAYNHYTIVDKPTGLVNILDADYMHPTTISGWFHHGCGGGATQVANGLPMSWEG